MPADQRIDVSTKKSIRGLYGAVRISSGSRVGTARSKLTCYVHPRVTERTTGVAHEVVVEVSTYDAVRRTGLFRIKEWGLGRQTLSFRLRMLPEEIRRPVIETSRRLNRLKGHDLGAAREDEYRVVLNAVRALLQWRLFVLALNEKGRVVEGSVRVVAPAPPTDPAGVWLDWRALESGFDLAALPEGRAAVDRANGAVLRWVEGFDLEGFGGRSDADPARYCRILPLEPGEELAWMRDFVRRPPGSGCKLLKEALALDDAVRRFRAAIHTAPSRVRRGWIAFRALRREAARLSWVAAHGIRPANPDPAATR